MATQTRSLNRDNGFGFPISAGAKLLEKKKIEGAMKPRRPLQELNCKNMENLGSSKALNNGASKTTKCFIADKPKQEKAKKNGGRRALGDLTNSSKLFQRDASSQKNGNMKLSSVVKKGEVVPDPAEEGCLHDHRECMKTQRYTMDIDYFLETVGLRKDCLTPIVSRKLPISTISKLESPSKLEFDCCGTLTPTKATLESPMMQPYQDVDALEFGTECDSLDFSGFKMKGSP